MSAIQYVEIPANGSSQPVYQVSQQNVGQDHGYQFVALPPGQQLIAANQDRGAQSNAKSSTAKRSQIKTLTNPEPELYQFVQLSSEDGGFDPKDPPVIIQLPDSFSLSDFQSIQLLSPGIIGECADQQSANEVSDGAALPFSILNLPDGSTFIPVSSVNDSSNASVNSQLIQLVANSADSSDQKDSDGNAITIERPVYVNEKQYHRIIKRREARDKLEKEGRIPKERRKYLHESRHRHAQNRTRREGGKFDSGNTTGGGQRGLATDDDSSSASNGNTPTPSLNQHQPHRIRIQNSVCEPSTSRK